MAASRLPPSPSCPSAYLPPFTLHITHHTVYKIYKILWIPTCVYKPECNATEMMESFSGNLDCVLNFTTMSPVSVFRTNSSILVRSHAYVGLLYRHSHLTIHVHTAPLKLCPHARSHICTYSPFHCFAPPPLIHTLLRRSMLPRVGGILAQINYSHGKAGHHKGEDDAVSSVQAEDADDFFPKGLMPSSPTTPNPALLRPL